MVQLPRDLYEIYQDFRFFLANFGKNPHKSC